jgi:hypothetical protein
VSASSGRTGISESKKRRKEKRRKAIANEGGISV